MRANYSVSIIVSYFPFYCEQRMLFDLHFSIRMYIVFAINIILLFTFNGVRFVQKMECNPILMLFYYFLCFTFPALVWTVSFLRLLKSYISIFLGLLFVRFFLCKQCFSNKIVLFSYFLANSHLQSLTTTLRFWLANRILCHFYIYYLLILRHTVKYFPD